MTKRRDRIFILVIVAAFLFTTIGVSVATILAIMSEKKQTNTAQQAPPPSSANKLKGTNMQDFTPVPNVTELQVTDLQPGTGEEIKATDTLTVDYTGAVAATGKVFESSLDSGQPATFALSGVIQGWQEGLLGMKVGGKRRLIIPAEKAYGAQSPSPDIPANAALVFDVTLHKIQHK
jgi:peptidylprolyl isomerase